ncbi:uncharacterized protein LOC101236754 isoform X1 [Hydra vulgaris]|uniref:Uncharacterized protein LOC101236754 isoform X1 n=2 Tax=Hydra vulgaris TaxID=6087 RepID=A0ABM4D7I6_HYDVU
MFFDHLSNTCLNIQQNVYKIESSYINDTPDQVNITHKKTKMQNTDGNIRYRTKSFCDLTPQDELLSLIREVENRDKESIEITETRKIPTIEIVEEPEATYRARYESEGCKGPIHGSTENCFPSIKIVGYVGEAVITVFVVTRDNEPHLHTATGPGSSKFECKEVRLSNGVQAIQMTMKPTDRNEEMLAVFDQLSIRRIRNWEADKELRDRGIEPVTWKTKKKEAKLAFHVSIPPSKPHSGYELTAYSRPFQCTAPSGNPEIYWSSHAEGSPVGGQEMGFHGKKFASGFRIRFFSKDDDGKAWEAYADIDRNKSSLHACVFKVPPYFQTHLVSDVSVYIEVRIGSEKEPRISEPVQFTYLAKSEKKCKNCDQYKSFITAIHQLFNGRQDLNGIVGLLQDVLNKNSESTKIDNQVLESFKNVESSASMNLNQNMDSKEFPFVNVSHNSHLNFPINTKRSGEVQILNNSEFSSEVNFTNELKPRRVSVGGFNNPLSNSSFTHLYPNGQADLSLQNVSTHSSMFSQNYINSLTNTFNNGDSYSSSHTTGLPSVEQENLIIKTDQADSLENYLNYSQIKNNNDCMSFADSEHGNIMHKEKKLIDNSVSNTLMNDSENSHQNFNSFSNSQVVLPAFTYASVDLHQSPLQASCCSTPVDKDLTILTSNVQDFKNLQEVMQLNLDFLEKQRLLTCNNLDHQGIEIVEVCNNQELPDKTDKMQSGTHNLHISSVNGLNNNQVAYQNHECEKNLLMGSYISLQNYQNKECDKKCLRSVSEQEFVCNLQAYSHGDDYVRVNQLYCPNTQIQEHSQNTATQNREIDASFMQHNFPASPIWVNRQLGDVSTEYNYYVNNTSNPTISFTSGDSSMNGLNCVNKAAVVSSPSSLSFSLGNSNLLNSLNQNDKLTSLAAFEHYPHIFNSENVRGNSQTNLVNEIQMGNVEGLKGW